jgi:hypothetical protein
MSAAVIVATVLENAGSGTIGAGVVVVGAGVVVDAGGRVVDVDGAVVVARRGRTVLSVPELLHAPVMTSSNTTIAPARR